jgi:hypothetical protein
MWTDWLERILRPRGRDEGKDDVEAARSVGAERARRFGQAEIDASRKKLESVEEPLWP